MKLQPVLTFDDLISEATPDREQNKFYNRDNSQTMRGSEETSDQRRADHMINQSRVQNKQHKFDPAAENSKQLKQELAETLRQSDHNYVDSAERVRSYINDEIEFGEDTHERIEHAKELIRYVASNSYKTT